MGVAPHFSAGQAACVFDLHVHASPDVVDRRFSDREVMEAYEAAGFSGCVLKGHYDATMGRAAAASAGLRLKAFGGLVLNQHVGGFNPAAVAAALMMGARVIWMPTVDARRHDLVHPPRLSALMPRLHPHSYATPPIDWATEEPVQEILSLLAEADAVLATGHLSAAEISWLVPAAKRCGVRRLLLTHPLFHVPAMTTREVIDLVGHGCFAEITAFQLLEEHSRGAGSLATFIREIGYEHVVLSSDVGHPACPAPPEALTLLVETLAKEGLDGDALVACASDNPERLVVP